MNTPKVIVKKYGNRRLYDTSASRYVNLEEIADMVRNGKEVQVVDATSGEDVTHVTMTQIIVEHAKDQPKSLPLELLRQLIVASDHAGQEFISWYLNSAMSTYQKLQTAIQGGISDVQSAAMSPISAVKKVVSDAIRPESEQNELEELRKRVADLESRLSKKETAAKKRSTPGKRKAKSAAR
ncbi:MAG TPA: polyhydroxyalkanoate synthesis regulator DNA-binding domain-containing protein [candidate division Zixibacteria bacterium]|nr:polyhydroxyalkanoate synthesis regulator DNA-binding domain-containing protein [candidate division Zixibacteria bacterium]